MPGLESVEVGSMPSFRGLDRDYAPVEDRPAVGESMMGSEDIEAEMLRMASSYRGGAVAPEEIMTLTP